MTHVSRCGYTELRCKIAGQDAYLAHDYKDGLPYSYWYILFGMGDGIKKFDIRKLGVKQEEWDQMMTEVAPGLPRLRMVRDVLKKHPAPFTLIGNSAQLETGK